MNKIEAGKEPVLRRIDGVKPLTPSIRRVRLLSGFCSDLPTTREKGKFELAAFLFFIDLFRITEKTRKFDSDYYDKSGKRKRTAFSRVVSWSNQNRFSRSEKWLRFYPNLPIQPIAWVCSRSFRSEQITRFRWALIVKKIHDFHYW